MNHYWIGELKLTGQPPLTVLYDPSDQEVIEESVRLFVSQLRQCVVYKKDLIRSYLKTIDRRTGSARCCLSRYREHVRVLFQADSNVDSIETYLDQYFESNLEELLKELDDDAMDYARSNEDGWFYADSYGDG